MNTTKNTVTVFQTLADLQTIIFAYSEFRTAAEVGLGDLPHVPRARRVAPPLKGESRNVR